MAAGSGFLTLTSNIAQIIDHFQYLKDTSGNTLQDIVEGVAEGLMPHLMEATPVGRHFSFSGGAAPGGALRSSLHFVIGQYGAYLEGAEHGRMVVTGTRPHPITPSGKRALAFFWEREGAGVVRRRVSHPGTRPNDFRQKAVEQAFESMTIQDVTNRILAQWVTENGA